MGSNDVYDFDTGADKNKKESVVNIVGSELPITSTILSASQLIGFTTSLILFYSHFHQVRLGTKTSSEVVKVGVMAIYSLLFAFGLSKVLPFTSIFLCALTLPMGKLVVNFFEENHKDNTKIFMAKYYCVRLHALFGTALAVGLVAARIVTKRYLPKPIFP